MERTKPSTLWIDGDSIGSYGHIYAPHCYELPPLTAGTPRIRIRIDNSPAVVPAEVQNSHAWSESTQTNWNGILGEFSLEARDCSYIEDVQVYPDPEKKCAEVRLSVFAEKRGKASVRLGGQSWNASETRRIVPVLRKVCLQKGRNELTFTIDMGDDPLLWSEFHPALYRLEIELRQGNRRDGCHVDFGMRRFYTEDAQLMLNGKKIFLRGKHDACVFPLTGYAPMDVDSWRRVFQIARQYGINHYRCHSYTPPVAAMRAADIEGVYLAVELPVWGSVKRKKTH